jgi:endonuclease YncB( thermonuclease family)
MLTLRRLVAIAVLLAAAPAFGQTGALRCLVVTTRGGCENVEALCDAGDESQPFHGAVKIIHLVGVDCPELDQAYGERAARFVIDQAGRRMVRATVKRSEPDGSVWGEIVLNDGRILNRELLLSGLAWWDWQHSDDQALGYLEQRAQSQQAGLWKDANPVPPWEHRKQHQPAPKPAAPPGKPLVPDDTGIWITYFEVLAVLAALCVSGLFIARRINKDYIDLNFVPIVVFMSAGFVLLTLATILVALGRE